MDACPSLMLLVRSYSRSQLLLPAAQGRSQPASSFPRPLLHSLLHHLVLFLLSHLKLSGSYRTVLRCPFLAGQWEEASSRMEPHQHERRVAKGWIEKPWCMLSFRKEARGRGGGLCGHPVTHELFIGDPELALQVQWHLCGRGSHFPHVQDSIIQI